MVYREGKIMNRLLFIILAVTLIPLSGCNDRATKKTYFERIDVNDRIANQQRLIDKGLSAGELTPSEADVVQDNLVWVKSEFGRMNEDRRFTMQERDEIDRLLDANSAMIRDKKQNAIRRFRP